MNRNPMLHLVALFLVGLGSTAARTQETPPPAPAPAKLANTLKWSTASEVDNYGFDVYRADKKEGPFTRLTKQPVAGAGTSDLKHEYQYVDDTIEAGREYFYFVESISLEGLREAFTPVFRAGPKTAAPPAPPPAQSDSPASGDPPAPPGAV